MALKKKIETEMGFNIDYWRVSKLAKLDPDNKQAVIVAAGYYNAKAREAGKEPYLEYEFLIRNEVKIVQETRPATVEEKKKLRPELVQNEMSDKEIDAIPYDIVVSTEEIELNHFDDFYALLEKGKWKEGAYNYLKSEDASQQFFNGATDII